MHAGGAAQGGVKTCSRLGAEAMQADAEVEAAGRRRVLSPHRREAGLLGEHNGSDSEAVGYVSSLRRVPQPSGCLGGL